MAAIVRFMSWRGKPKKIVSDIHKYNSIVSRSSRSISNRGTRVEWGKSSRKGNYSVGSSILQVLFILEKFANVLKGAERKLCLLFWVPDP